MAEATVATLIIKIGEVVIDQAATYAGSLRGIPYQMQNIKRELELMRAYLRYADMRNVDDQLLRVWARTVRDVAFQIEDIIDEYTFVTGELIMTTHCGCLKGYLNVFKKNKRLLGIATRLGNIESSLALLSTGRTRYQINIPEGEPSSSSPTSAHDVSRQLAETAHFMRDDDIVGRDENKRQLAEWLMDARPRRSLITIWGMGGVGKTMLATNAYKSPEAARHFVLRAWVSVSQSCPANDLLRRIIRELHREKKEATPAYLDNMSYRDLVDTVQSILKRKTYLIILDDLWDRAVWTQINLAMVDNGHGSRVIITTRDEEVASEADDGMQMKLEPLNEEDSRRLFYKSAFYRLSDDAQRPPELEDLARKIVSKCEGLPLALVCMGNLAAQRGRAELPYLQYIDDSLANFFQAYDHLATEESDNVDLRRVHAILDLSISKLPHFLRSCFLYCSIFPRDHVIKRKTLVRLWVAEGFIKERIGRTMEEVAEWYLNMLIGRCLFHVVNRNSRARVKSIKVHDLVHDVIVKKSKKDDFYDVYEGRSRRRQAEHLLRRLSFVEGEETSQTSRVKRLPQLRSFHVFSSSFSGLSGFFFKLIRVLNLEEAPIESLPDRVVCHFNLRFLSIRGTKVKNLPEGIGNLRNLETLDAIRSKITELPNGITKLENLRHLMASTFWGRSSGYGGIRTAVRVPQGICNLRNLQTLKYVGATSLVDTLGSMNQIRTLHVAVLTVTACSTLCDSISCMTNLLNLRIQSFGQEETQVIDPACNSTRSPTPASATPLRVPGVLHMKRSITPPPQLQKLLLLGNLKNGDLPNWFDSLSNLTHLELQFCKLKHNSVLKLNLLPQLVNLRLVGAYDGSILCIPSGWLGNLKSMSLMSMDRLVKIIIERNALQSLESMSFTKCKMMETVPVGMRYLTNLKKLILDDMPSELVVVIRHYGDEVKHIPYIEHWYQKDGNWNQEVVSQKCFTMPTAEPEMVPAAKKSVWSIILVGTAILTIFCLLLHKIGGLGFASSP